MVTNTHITTPYSFSPFTSIDEILKEANRKRIVALGINDKNSTDGFGEFASVCEHSGIYPIYNIGLSIHDNSRQQRDIHGKAANIQESHPLQGLALRTPSPFSSDTKNLLASIWKQSQDRIWKMIDKTNRHLSECAIPIQLDYNRIRTQIAKNSLHELHLSKALQIAIAAEAKKRNQSPHVFYTKLCKHTPDEDIPLHWRYLLHQALFSPGKAGYVTEMPSIHLSLQQAKEILLHAGAIPCYLCDFQNSSEMESPETLLRFLTGEKIHAIEFIPQFTDKKRLSVYMQHFDRNDICVTVGTGCYIHTTPLLLPQTIDGAPLQKDLLEISFRGTCILAAHQESHKTGKHGFIDSSSNRLLSGNELEGFIAFGADIIKKYSQKSTQLQKK